MEAENKTILFNVQLIYVSWLEQTLWLESNVDACYNLVIFSYIYYSYVYCISHILIL